MVGVTRRDVRFGIRVGELRSHTWRVRSGTKRRELFIEREGLESALHVSLHESGRWHMKLRGEPVFHWLRPVEMHPGYTRAMVISQPWAIAMLSDAALEGSILVPLDEGDEQTPQFNIFVERSGANLATWPGSRSMRTDLIARLPMTDGCTCCVVVHRARIEPGTQKLAPANLDERRAIQELLNRADTMMTLVGVAADGAITLTDTRSEAGVPH